MQHTPQLVGRLVDLHRQSVRCRSVDKNPDTIRRQAEAGRFHTVHETQAPQDQVLENFVKDLGDLATLIQFGVNRQGRLPLFSKTRRSPDTSRTVELQSTVPVDQRETVSPDHHRRPVNRFGETLPGGQYQGLQLSPRDLDFDRRQPDPLPGQTAMNQERA